MSRAVIFMPAARLDVIDAQDWYERKARGLRDLVEGIFVIACFHSSRDPLIWRSRV